MNNCVVAFMKLFVCFHIIFFVVVEEDAVSSRLSITTVGRLFCLWNI